MVFTELAHVNMNDEFGKKSLFRIELVSEMQLQTQTCVLQ